MQRAPVLYYEALTVAAALCFLQRCLALPLMHQQHALSTGSKVNGSAHPSRSQPSGHKPAHCPQALKACKRRLESVLCTIFSRIVTRRATQSGGQAQIWRATRLH
eukprot:14737-Heterococcus_DN1.PRE.2